MFAEPIYILTDTIIYPELIHKIQFLIGRKLELVSTNSSINAMKPNLTYQYNNLPVQT